MALVVVVIVVAAVIVVVHGAAEPKFCQIWPRAATPIFAQVDA